MNKNAITFLLLSMLFGLHAMAEQLIVSVTGGDIKGIVKDKVVSFKGIPFAAPPIGNLRWQPPRPTLPWKGYSWCQ